MKISLEFQAKQKKVRKEIKEKKTRHLGYCHEKIARKRALEREEQLKKAVLYCNENNCKGYAAITSGLFPLIKDHRTINRRLEDSNNKIEIGEEKSYCQILTSSKEKEYVRYLMNK